MTSWRGATSKQHRNNVVYFNVGIYNVKQRRINLAYFNFDMNNGVKRRNNVVKTASSKKNKNKSFQIEYIKFKIFTTIS